MARTPIIAGNWKMNTSYSEAVELASRLSTEIGSHSDIERVVIPPFPWIVSVSEAVAGSGITVGAQNCYSEFSGAFTGEVSPKMLDEHCSHVILGHSERRHVLGESDDLIRAKLETVLSTDLTAILCVGETLEERESGRAQATVLGQLTAALDSLESAGPARIVIAYEPVWAIGTGRAASSEDAQEMCAFIRESISDMFGKSFAEAVRIQYGGSVKADNAVELLANPDVDGALVGGASLDASEFAAIVRAASTTSN